MPCNMVRHFHVRHFQSPRLALVLRGRSDARAAQAQGAISSSHGCPLCRSPITMVLQIKGQCLMPDFQHSVSVAVKLLP